MTRLSRRRVLGAMGALSVSGLAGCGGPESTSLPEESRAEHIEDECTVHQTIGAGESMGFRYYDEQYRLTVTNVSDESIDFTIEKVLLDESGANKESVDARLAFRRMDVSPGEVERIEDDMRVWYIEHTDDGAYLCLGDGWVNAYTEPPTTDNRG